MADFGTEAGKPGFNEITKQYKASPTIENYVRLRRQYPEGEIEIATTGGIEFLFSQEKQLISYGISPRTVARVLDADLDAQADLSLKLLEQVIERKEKEKSGETHIVSRKHAISDTFVNYLITEALDALSWNDELEISRELIVLIKHQLGSISSQYEAEVERRTKTSQARLIAAQIVARGETPTYRKIGRIMSIQASTVMRWFPDGTFISEAKELAEALKHFGFMGKLESGPSDSE